MKMEHLKLTRPMKELEAQFIEFINEFRSIGETRPERAFEESKKNFDFYLKWTARAEQNIDLPPNTVPFTTYWLVRNDQDILGSCHLRHYLNPPLEIEGGHIGYNIRPDERQKGYGTRQLELILKECPKHHLHDVLITCDADNIGSKKIIENNGGILENQVFSPYSNKPVLRFWIHLGEASS